MSTVLDQLENILISGHLASDVKTATEYDILDRVEYVHTAKANALNGDPCLTTRYAYFGSTTRVAYMKEYVGVWDSSWETF